MISAPLDLDRLRRRPDVEGPGLHAVDAADRLLLDTAGAPATGPGAVVVIGDAYGALTLGAVAAGATAVRSHQDALTGERALARNAVELGFSDAFASLPLTAETVRGARVVLVRLPRSLDALADVAGLVAAHAHPDVVVYAGGRIKHMSLAMNDVLGRFFGRVDVSHARQKSRVLIARAPRGGADPVPRATRDGGVEIRAFGGVFAGARLDHGTRFLLDRLPDALAGGTADDPLIDFACGNGVVAAWLALRHPDARVYATDHSAAAAESARETSRANRVTDRVEVDRSDLLERRAAASASTILLNPPFHSVATVTDRLAPRLFADAARVLRPGGRLWCVWNSPLGYRPVLQRMIGETTQVARNSRFTVTVSTRR
ncbi:class I SAM-dependent methyltransferase [Microbacterium sp.]|uniref:class I SAM-dependent methyltransferase n=1 Tax=Microbacterium sp. TaxID=51671 RepID=UPI003A8981DB